MPAPAVLQHLTKWRVFIVLTLVNFALHGVVHEALDHPPRPVLFATLFILELFALQFKFIYEMNEHLLGLYRAIGGVTHVNSTLAHIDQHTGIVGIDKRRVEILRELEMLATGNLVLNNRTSVYLHDVDYLDTELRRGDCFRATVRLPHQAWDLDRFFENGAFHQYLEAMRRARARGVRVQRIYYIPEQYLEPMTPGDPGKVVRNHLDELVEAGLEIRYKKLGPADQSPGHIFEDLVLFGDARGSTADVPVHLLDDEHMRTEFTSDPGKLLDMRTKWNALWTNPKLLQPYKPVRVLTRDQVIDLKVRHLDRLNQVKRTDKTAHPRYRSLVCDRVAGAVTARQLPGLDGYLKRHEQASQLHIEVDKYYRLASEPAPADTLFWDHFTRVHRTGAAVRYRTHPAAGAPAEEYYLFDDGYCAPSALLVTVAPPADGAGHAFNCTLTTDETDIKSHLLKWDELWEHQRVTRYNGTPPAPPPTTAPVGGS